MLENVLLNCVPRPLTTAMIATEMPAAIKPYSIAVAPDGSFQNRVKSLDKASLLGFSSPNQNMLAEL